MHLERKWECAGVVLPYYKGGLQEWFDRNHTTHVYLDNFSKKLVRHHSIFKRLRNSFDDASSRPLHAHHVIREVVENGKYSGLGNSNYFNTHNIITAMQEGCDSFIGLAISTNYIGAVLLDSAITLIFVYKPPTRILTADKKILDVPDTDDIYTYVYHNNDFKKVQKFEEVMAVTQPLKPTVNLDAWKATHYNFERIAE